MVLEMPVGGVVHQRGPCIEDRRIHAVPGDRATQVGILEIVHVVGTLPNHFRKLVHAVAGRVDPTLQAVVLRGRRVRLHVVNRINGNAFMGDLLKRLGRR